MSTDRTDGPSRLPTRADTHVYEDESRRKLSGIFCDPYFIFREESKNDYGTDCLIEALVDNGRSPSNLRTHVQLKSTTTDLNQDGSLSYSVSVANLAYLLNAPNSVYVLYHRPTDEFYWRYAQDVKADATKAGKNWEEITVAVRCTDKLDSQRVKEIHAAVVEYGRTETEIRVRQPSNAHVIEALKAVLQRENQAKRLDSALSILLSQAVQHYEDGIKKRIESSFQQARLSFDHAIALFHEDVPSLAIKGNVLIAATSICILLHDLRGVRSYLDRLDQLLANSNPDDALEEQRAVANELRASSAAALGGWSPHVHSMLAQAISFFKAKGEPFRLAQSIQNAAETALQCGRLAEAYSFMEGFGDALDRIEDHRLMALMAVHGLATLGNLALATCENLPPQDLKVRMQLRDAVSKFEQVKKFADDHDLIDLGIKASLAMAKCHWFLMDYDVAISISESLLTPEISREFPREFMFAAYNLALVFAEAKRDRDALRQFREIRPIYESVGDQDTVVEIDRWISSLENK